MLAHVHTSENVLRLYTGESKITFDRIEAVLSVKSSIYELFFQLLYETWAVYCTLGMAIINSQEYGTQQ